MSEQALVQAILLALGRDPAVVLAWRNNSGAIRTDAGRLLRFGLPGSPDILAVVAPLGRLVGIEAKAAAGRQTPQQRAFQVALERVGGIYCLARSVDAALAAVRQAQGGV